MSLINCGATSGVKRSSNGQGFDPGLRPKCKPLSKGTMKNTEWIFLPNAPVLRAVSAFPHLILLLAPIIHRDQVRFFPARMTVKVEKVRTAAMTGASDSSF